jgi:dynein heavy chain
VLFCILLQHKSVTLFKQTTTPPPRRSAPKQPTTPTGGGKNDIPNRLKRQFGIFNVPLPSAASVNAVFGALVAGRFPAAMFAPEVVGAAARLVPMTVALWTRTQARMLPTRAKFHYLFNMRELSKVFQGVILAERDRFNKAAPRGGYGGGVTSPEGYLLALWLHECRCVCIVCLFVVLEGVGGARGVFYLPIHSNAAPPTSPNNNNQHQHQHTTTKQSRVFGDKLVSLDDKAWLDKQLAELCKAEFAPELCRQVEEPLYFVDFLRDPTADPETGEIINAHPSHYEAVQGGLPELRARVESLQRRFNEESKGLKLELMLFTDALQHLARISRLLAMDRGSALLVGVGGSGKQSLARLAAYIAGAHTFQVCIE